MSEKKKIVVSKRLVAINSASSIFTRLLNITVLVWMYQHLLARIPAEEFAIYPVVTAIMVIAPVFFAFFQSSISRHVVDAYAKGDFEGVGRIVSSVMPMLALAAGVFLVAGVAFGLNIEDFLNVAPAVVEDAHLMMVLLVLSFVFQMVALPFVTGYHVHQRFVELNMWMVARDLLRIALTLIFLLGVEDRVLWVVVATVISEVLFQLVTMTRSRRMTPELRFDVKLIDWGKANELFNFGLWTTLGRLGSLLYVNAATLVLNVHGTAIDVNSFYVGATFFRQLNMMLNTAVLPLQPALTAMNATEDRRRFASTIFRGGRYALWVSMTVAGPMIVFADDLVALYLDEKYADAADVLIMFMIVLPFTQPTVLLAMASMAMARVREFFLPAFLFQALGFVLMLVFVSWLDMGALGVTLALAAITIGSQVFYYWWLCVRLTETSVQAFFKQVLLPGLLPVIAGGVVWFGLKLVAPVEGWIQLFLYGALGGVVYLVVLFGFCLTSADKRDLAAILDKIRRRKG